MSWCTVAELSLPSFIGTLTLWIDLTVQGNQTKFGPQREINKSICSRPSKLDALTSSYLSSPLNVLIKCNGDC